MYADEMSQVRLSHGEKGIISMKICISSTGPDENAQVSSVFGRCPYFIVYDDQEKKYGTLKNEAWQAARGAGIAAAQKVSDAGCQVLITGNVGPNAFYALQSAGIKAFQGTERSVQKAVKDFQEGKLNRLEKPAGRCSFGRGRDFVLKIAAQTPFLCLKEVIRILFMSFARVVVYAGRFAPIRRLRLRKKRLERYLSTKF